MAFEESSAAVQCQSGWSMSHVPRLDLLYRRAPRRRFFSVAILWLLLLGACAAVTAILVRYYLHHTVGARRALIAARQTALAQARATLTGIERVSVTRSEADREQFIVTGEGINPAGLRCRFTWRSNPSTPAGSLSIEPLMQ